MASLFIRLYKLLPFSSSYICPSFLCRHLCRICDGFWPFILHSLHKSLTQVFISAVICVDRYLLYLWKAEEPTTVTAVKNVAFSYQSEFAKRLLVLCHSPLLLVVVRIWPKAISEVPLNPCVYKCMSVSTKYTMYWISLHFITCVSHPSFLFSLGKQSVCWSLSCFTYGS
jgi:hypothetical protein